MTLALFDFDGTITNKDSLLHFTSFAKGRTAFYIGLLLLAPVLILQKLGLLSSQKTKNIFISWFFKNMKAAIFEDITTRYVAKKINSIVLETAVKKISWHIQNGHRVIVVSASPEDYLQKWCSAMQLECIATRLQKADGKITGKIEGINCKGKEKAIRIKASVNINTYTEIYGYGNSGGDKEMLALCSKTFYKPFH